MVITCNSLMGIRQETIPNPMFVQFLLFEKRSNQRDPQTQVSTKNYTKIT